MYMEHENSWLDPQLLGSQLSGGWICTFRARYGAQYAEYVPTCLKILVLCGHQQCK